MVNGISSVTASAAGAVRPQAGNREDPQVRQFQEPAGKTEAAPPQTGQQKRPPPAAFSAQPENNSEPSRPTVNTSGQTVGRIISTSV
ncbi:MAG: hypothetical protein Q8O34_08785 [Rhodocyclaceae bacterium]|nr:hypothetical protein [Rhodocyclaceae bacterium]